MQYLKRIKRIASICLVLLLIVIISQATTDTTRRYEVSENTAASLEYIQKKQEFFKLKEICDVDITDLPKAEKCYPYNAYPIDLPEEEDEAYEMVMSQMESAPEYVYVEGNMTVHEAKDLVNLVMSEPSMSIIDKESGINISWIPNETNYLFTPCYIEGGQETNYGKMKVTLDEIGNNILQLAENNEYTDTPEKLAVFLTVWMSEHCVYREETIEPLDRTAYGALVDGVAVCSGYTAAFDYLMIKAGYDAYIFDGKKVDSEENVKYHRWPGYTGSDGTVLQCDPTQAAYDYQEGYWSWKNYVNFTGKNRRYEVYKTYHFLAGK